MSHADADADDDTEPLGAEQGDIAGAVLIDVRRSAAFAQAQHMLPGAVWHDPQAVPDWAAQLDSSRTVVVYCIHGHEVSRHAARQLCALGLQARFLRGGFEAWKDADLPLVDKPGACARSD